MPTLIESPKVMAAHGQPPKSIEEFVGRANTGEDRLSIARMVSPVGWSEPGQTPEFTEFTIVLRGTLKVESANGSFDVREGQALVATAGEWVRYSTPYPGGAEYLAVCLPAFTPARVQRDE